MVQRQLFISRFSETELLGVAKNFYIFCLLQLFGKHLPLDLIPLDKGWLSIPKFSTAVDYSHHSFNYFKKQIIGLQNCFNIQKYAHQAIHA